MVREFPAAAAVGDRRRGHRSVRGGPRCRRSTSRHKSHPLMGARQHVHIFVIKQMVKMTIILRIRLLISRRRVRSTPIVHPRRGMNSGVHIAIIEPVSRFVGHGHPGRRSTGAGEPGSLRMGPTRIEIGGHRDGRRGMVVRKHVEPSRLRIRGQLVRRRTQSFLSGSSNR